MPLRETLISEKISIGKMLITSIKADEMLNCDTLFKINKYLTELKTVQPIVNLGMQR